MKKFTKVLALVLVTVVAALSMVACAPNSNPEKAEKALKDEGYVTIRLSDALTLTATELALGCSRGDIVAVVSGTKKNEDKIDTVSIIYFKDSSAAKSAWDKAKAYLEDETEKETESDVVVEKSGKMIYGGTKAGIKAAQ